MEILRERRRIKDKIIEEVSRWAKGIPFKATVILIGSYARGDFNLWSDIDVMMMAEFNSRPIERIKNIDHPPGLEVIPLTPKEFRRLAERRNPLALEALSRGIVLRDDLNIGEQVKDISAKST